MRECLGEKNIHYAFTRMNDIDNKIKIINSEIDKYSFYEFGEEYIEYILNIINKIEVEENDKNLYEMIEFSNQDIKSYRKDFREYHHIVSIIARHNEIEEVKIKYYKEIYHSKLGIDNYDLMLISIINNINGLLLNIRTVPKYSYATDEFNYKPKSLTFIKEVFIDGFPYITEFLEILFNYRLKYETKEIDNKYILEVMNNIINKYKSSNKVLRIKKNV